MIRVQHKSLWVPIWMHVFLAFRASFAQDISSPQISSNSTSLKFVVREGNSLEIAYYDADGAQSSTTDTLATTSKVVQMNNTIHTALAELANASSSVIESNFEILSTLDTYVKEMQICLQNGQWYEQGQCVQPQVPTFHEFFSYDFTLTVRQVCAFLAIRLLAASFCV